MYISLAWIAGCYPKGFQLAFQGTLACPCGKYGVSSTVTLTKVPCASVTFGSSLTWGTPEKTCMGSVQLLHGKTLAKLLFGSSRAYVNWIIGLNDSSFRKKSSFSQLRKPKLFEAFPGDGAVLKPFVASRGTSSEDRLPFPDKFQACIIYDENNRQFDWVPELQDHMLKGPHCWTPLKRCSVPSAWRGAWLGVRRLPTPTWRESLLSLHQKGRSKGMSLRGFVLCSSSPESNPCSLF